MSRLNINRITALFILLAFGVISITTCLSTFSKDVTCSDSRCAENQSPVQDPVENDADRCCGHAGHCGHASAMLFGCPSYIVPSQTDERLVCDDEAALEGPVFGIDRPPQLARS